MASHYGRPGYEGEEGYRREQAGAGMPYGQAYWGDYGQPTPPPFGPGYQQGYFGQPYDYGQPYFGGYGQPAQPPFGFGYQQGYPGQPWAYDAPSSPWELPYGDGVLIWASRRAISDVVGMVHYFLAAESYRRHQFSLEEMARYRPQDGQNGGQVPPPNHPRGDLHHGANPGAGFPPPPQAEASPGDGQTFEVPLYETV